ncbi:MAG TPA: hypothetical protein VH765_11730 [Xanthobacteraceae bacterium]|jgi:hypothetical protein
MSEIVDLSQPEISGAQQNTIVRASDAFSLWSNCARPACRRARGCRGFAEGPIPRCTPTLAQNVFAVLRPIMALVPGRDREAKAYEEVNRRIDDIMRRAAMVMERQLEAIEQKAGIERDE